MAWPWITKINEYLFNHMLTVKRGQNIVPYFFVDLGEFIIKFM